MKRITNRCDQCNGKGVLTLSECCSAPLEPGNYCPECKTPDVDPAKCEDCEGTGIEIPYIPMKEAA